MTGPRAICRSVSRSDREGLYYGLQERARRVSQPAEQSTTAAKMIRKMRIIPPRRGQHGGRSRAGDAGEIRQASLGSGEAGARGMFRLVGWCCSSRWRGPAAAIVRAGPPDPVLYSEIGAS